jgi:hypothetical protein
MVKLGPTRFAITVEDNAAAYPVVIDPLTKQWYYTASQSDEAFGFAVADPGNILGGGDYYGRIIVGAAQYDTGSLVDAGAVFAFYGSSDLPATPSWTQFGDQAGGHLGYSVSTAGDVDGDGYYDVIVGAANYSSDGYTRNGRAYVFAGGPNGLASTPMWTGSGTQSYAMYGSAVVYVGNLIDSSYADFAVASPTYYNTGNYDGLISVYKGSASGPVFLQNLLGSDSSMLGFSLAAGDVNGDTYRDLIAGAPAGAYSSSPGAVIIYYGSSTGFGANTTTLAGEAAGDNFGFSVADVSDTDGDGIDDILVGDPYHTVSGKTYAGKAYLFLGHYPTVNTSPAWSVPGDQTEAQLGFSVAGGSVYEGVTGLVIGAPYYSSAGNTENGEAWFYVASGGTPTLDTIVVGTESYDLNGASVAYLPLALYRTPGIAVGAPYAHDQNGNLLGGIVTVWTYNP